MSRGIARDSVGNGIGRAGAVVLGAWMLGLLVLTVVFSMHERESQAEHAPVYAADLRAQIAEVDSVPFEAAPGHGASASQVRAQIATSEKRVRRTLRELERIVSHDNAERLEKATTDYFSTIEYMVSLAAAGQLENAGFAIERAEQKGGSTWELRHELDVTEAAVRDGASRARLVSTLGTVVAVLLALVAFSWALLRMTRARGRAEDLAEVNARLLALSRHDAERYRDLFDNANEPIATVDLEWTLTGVNHAFANALGYTRDELIGTKLTRYQTEEGRAQSKLHRERKLAGLQRAATYEQTLIAKDGSHVIFEVSTRLLEEDGVPVGIQGLCRDITARKEAENELRHFADLNRYQAHHDALTGLPNRLHFHDEIERAIAAGRRRGPFAVALIDLDRFKEINDSLGHRAGDVLLQQLSHALAGVVRKPDIVARLGGDEFGVLLNGVQTNEGWAEMVGRIKDAVERPVLVDGIPVNVEASIGIAIHPTHGDGVDALLQRADVAMYVAKTTGRGHAVYTPREDPNDASKLALLGELRRALAQRELTLRYQPIVEHGARTAQVEALLRWEHPTHGLISPAEFLPLAERTGLIRPLTLYVLEEAVRQCKQWEREGYRLTVSVNLSTRNLSEADLVNNVVRILEEWKLDPSRLILEITESAVMSDPQDTRRTLARLTEHGIKVAIDDFGAGFTSLSHLAHLPIDEIKIDRSFVTDLTTDSSDRAIVRSIISLSHDLGLSVVAEGVETQAVLDALQVLGCDRVQGYYFAKPLGPDDIRAWLAETPDQRRARAA